MKQKKVYFPSNKTMLITLAVLTLFYGIDFYINKEKLFLQTRYDWNNVTIEKKIGSVKPDSISYNFIRIKFPNNYNTDCQNSFLLHDSNNNNYYFRAVYTIKKNKTISFYGLQWLIQQPPKEKAFMFSEVKIPLIKKGTQSVVSIGDALLSENEAKYFRINLADKAPVFFKGKWRDVFNYPHYAKKDFNIDSILKITENIEPADYYILFFDEKNQVDAKKLQLLKTRLLKNNPEKIFWLTNSNIQNKKTPGLGDEKTLIINIRNIIKKNNKTLLNGSSLNKNDYIELSNTIAKYINDR